MSQQSGGVKTRAFKAAFPKVLPRMVYSLKNVNPLAGGHGAPKQSPSQ